MFVGTHVCVCQVLWDFIRLGLLMWSLNSDFDELTQNNLRENKVILMRVYLGKNFNIELRGAQQDTQPKRLVQRPFISVYLII